MIRDRRHIDPARFIYLLERGMAKKGLTQEELGRALGKAGAPVRQTTVSAWMRGTIPRNRYLSPLMDILDFTWEDMLTPQAQAIESERAPETIDDLRTKYQQLEARVRDLEQRVNTMIREPHRPFRARSVASL